jgi:hypothetical protein
MFDNELSKGFVMDGFEGYVGILVGDRQLLDDLVFSLLLVLFFVFSLVFHANYRLFMKMIRDITDVKERLSLFEDIDGNETVFRSFMIFQSLFLASLTLFIAGRSYGYIADYQDVRQNLFAIGFIFVVLFSFYLFKQFFYKLSGGIFASPDLYKTWRTGYTAATGFWGVLLYFPVLCLAFTEIHIRIPLFMSLFLYVLWRLVIIYKTICIFHVKGAGFLYIILYLCAQEILPLIFLYEGIIYLYNLY